MAAFVGTALEWYDFFIYGTAAALVFNKVFFPALSPVAGTLAAFAAFGVGFVARPLGGLLLGNLGDRLGRREILLLTLLLMGVATVGIGLLPGYQTIGIWAPLLLVLARLVQGFAAGAEYAGAVVISVENAPARRRGLFGSWACLGVAFSVLASTGVFAVFNRLPHSDFLAWGWRMPFLLSVILIAGAQSLAESPAQRPSGYRLPPCRELLWLRLPCVSGRLRHEVRWPKQWDRSHRRGDRLGG
jgi:MFS family permease